MEEACSSSKCTNDDEDVSKYFEANNSPGALKLRSWLNKSLRIEMTDKRVLIGIFLCTDRDANVILGSCSEYLPEEESKGSINEEPRMLGLVMVPGKHIVNVSIDENGFHSTTESLEEPLTDTINEENVV